jgi:hypothetical protein
MSKPYQANEAIFKAFGLSSEEYKTLTALDLEKVTARSGKFQDRDAGWLLIHGYHRKSENIVECRKIVVQDDIDLLFTDTFGHLIQRYKREMIQEIKDFMGVQLGQSSAEEGGY